jgi:hypothetical protein
MSEKKDLVASQSRGQVATTSSWANLAKCPPGVTFQSSAQYKKDKELKARQEILRKEQEKKAEEKTQLDLQEQKREEQRQIFLAEKKIKDDLKVEVDKQKNLIFAALKQECKNRDTEREFQKFYNLQRSGWGYYTGHWWLRLPLPGAVNPTKDKELCQYVAQLELLPKNKDDDKFEFDDSVMIVKRQLFGQETDAWEILIGDGYRRLSGDALEEYYENSGYYDYCLQLMKEDKMSGRH